MPRGAASGRAGEGRLRRTIGLLRAVDSVSLSVRRPNEHTDWRPRWEYGYGFGMAGFKCLHVAWQMDPRRMPPTDLDALRMPDITPEEADAFIAAIGGHDYGDPGAYTGHEVVWCFTHVRWEDRATGQEAVDA